MWQDGLASTRTAFIADLEARGFTQDDDGNWKGKIPVASITGSSVLKPHRIAIPEDFPFTWPRVYQQTRPAALTWHLNPDGQLCMYAPSDEASRPWELLDQLFARVYQWYENSLNDWPEDPAAPDLERYFPRELQILISYDGDQPALGELFVERRSENWLHLRPPVASDPAMGRQKLWGYGVDLGRLDKPVHSWSTLCRAIDATERADVQEHSRRGNGLLLVHYERVGSEGSRTAAVGLYVRHQERRPAVHHGRVTTPPHFDPQDQPTISATEIADDGPTARHFRAGIGHEDLADKRLAIVGCGAIGSFTAALLARSGVGHLTLVDPEILKPGNCVRHLADSRYVPKPKVEAIREVLLEQSLITNDAVVTHQKRIDPALAFDLLTGTDLVIDATADAGATGLLRHLSEQIGRVTFLRVALHNDGDVVTVDRFGNGTPTDTERPPRVESTSSNNNVYRESGCGDPVSPTSPDAVIEVAAIACRWAIDQLRPFRSRVLPDSCVHVLRPTQNCNYVDLGIVH